MPDKNYRDLHSVLEKVLKDYNLSPTLAEEDLIDKWVEIVGAKLADKCYPVKLEEGELTIKTKNKIWRDELALRQQDLVNLLDRQIGSALVKKIKII